MTGWMQTRLGLIALALLCSGPAGAKSRPYQSVGWRPTAIPIANYSSDDGTGFGLRAYLYQYDGRTIPYRRAWTSQAFLTTGGKWVHRLKLDTPSLRPGQRLELEAVYEKEEYANYYGGLSDEEVDDLLGDTDARTRRQLTTFRQAYPTLRADCIRDLRMPWRLRTSLQAGHASIAANAAQGSLLEALSPLGAEGGTLVKAGISVRYDTRDDYNDSQRGTLEEFLVEYGLGGGGSFHGGRVSLEHRHFLTLPGELVLAHRFVADLAFGELPFFEELSLGGSSTVRGLAAARVRGQGRLLANAELRWRGLPLLERQHIYLGGLLFADAGQIFTRAEGPGLDDWRASRGGGVRLLWQSTVVRADWGTSGKRTGIYITFDHLF